MDGLHILAELHDCQCAPHLLRQVDELQRICRAACAAGPLTIVAEAFHGFDSGKEPAGATGAIVLAESHLAVHSWPEIGASGAVTLDLYVCNFSRDNRQSAERTFAFLCNTFLPARIARQDVRRGVLNAS